MKGTLKLALVAFALAGGTLAGGMSAQADSVSVGVGPGGIAFGYSDGYWDQGHQWHAWHDNAEAQRWRNDHRDHYYDRKHDADAAMGWRENDHYWDRR